MKKTLREALEDAASARDTPPPPATPAAGDNLVAFPAPGDPNGPLVDTSGREVDDGFLDSLRDPASVLTYQPATDLRRHPHGEKPAAAPPPTTPPTAAAPPPPPPVFGARDAMIERLRSPHVAPPEDETAEREYDPTRPSRRLPVLGLTSPAASPLDTEAEPGSEADDTSTEALVELLPLPEVAEDATATDDDPDGKVRTRHRRQRPDCPACGHPARVEDVDLDQRESRLRCQWCDHEFVLPLED
ncbi:MAG: hypothetical protein MUF83_10755 [Acidimicrobiales bacterium]|jgi:hypothetical protein|nr:hypothetical protein [Acidimicrobiales bacterium]